MAILAEENASRLASLICLPQSEAFFKTHFCCLDKMIFTDYLSYALVFAGFFLLSMYWILQNRQAEDDNLIYVSLTVGGNLMWYAGLTIFMIRNQKK